RDHRHAGADRGPDAAVRIRGEPPRRPGGSQHMNRRPFALYTAMLAVYAFLYIPIFSVIAYSFNASRVSTVWGGFSLRWYGELLANQQQLDALQRSLLIAAITPTGSQ